MSSIKNKRGKTNYQNFKYAADYAHFNDDHNDHNDHEDHDDHEGDVTIDDATKAVAYYNEMFGRKRSKKRSMKRSKNNRSSRQIRQRQTSRRKHSFGINADSNFKRFLIITTLLLIRAAVKKNPDSISSDIKNIQYGALNFLTVASLIELIGHLFGATIRDHVVLGYLVINIGLNMSELI